MRLGRPGRRTILSALPLLLGGCGFEPLYGGDPSSPAADLPAIYVDNIAAGHLGQLLREELQARLDSPDNGAASRYRLTVGPAISAAGIAIQPDNSSTYTRVIGTANWTLVTVGITPKTLAHGSARALDGYNNIDQQYFQSTLSSDTVNARLMQNLADQISLQLAAWFRSAREKHDRDVLTASSTDDPS